MIGEFISFVLSNFTLTFLVIGIIFSIISILCNLRKISGKIIAEALFAYFLLFSIGFSFIYNFVCHTFFAQEAAAFIGWANSPFQYEVGYASLGIGIAGLIAFKGCIGFRTATIIIPAFFLWGAAGGHIYQMITIHDYSPGNAGIIFWTDMFLPIIGFTLLIFQYRFKKKSTNLLLNKFNLNN